MKTSELIQRIQERLAAELNETQVRQLEDLLEQQHPAIEAAVREMEHQQIEVIPVELDAESVEPLIQWLEQLAQTRPTTRNTSWLISVVAVLILIGLGAFGVNYFQTPVATDPQAAADLNSNAVHPSPRVQKTKEEVRPSAAEPGNTAKAPFAGSSQLKSDFVPMIGALEYAPDWALLDDKASRGQLDWIDDLKQLTVPMVFEGISVAPIAVNGETRHFDLSGKLRLPGLRDDGTSLRLRLADIRTMKISFDNPGEHLELAYASSQLHLSSFQPVRVPEEIRSLPVDVDSRLKRLHCRTTIDPVISFHWKDAAPIVAGSAIDPDFFAARWTGQLEVPKDGHYKFFVRADDGARLQIDNQLVINRWQVGDLFEASAELDLKQGSHELVLEYFSDLGLAEIQLEWESTDFPRQVIPAKSLRSDATPNAKPGLWGLYAFGGYLLPNSPSQIKIDSVTDQFAWHRTNRGTFDLRYQNGHLVVARGKIPLVALPMSQPPELITLAAQASLRLFQPIRLAPLESLKARFAAKIPDSPRNNAAKKGWKLQYSDKDTKAEIQKNKNGTIDVNRTQGQGPFRVETVVNLDGTTEVLLEMKQVRPHTGIGFQHPQNDVWFNYFASPCAGRNILCVNPVDRNNATIQYFNGVIAADSIWWKAVYADSYLSIQFSNDGEHWIVLHYERLNQELPVRKQTLIAMIGYNGPGTRSAKLDSIVITHKNALEQLAHALPVNHVPAITALTEEKQTGKSADQAIEPILEQRPDHVPTWQWPLACYAKLMISESTPLMRQDAAVRLLKHAVATHDDHELIRKALLHLPQRIVLKRSEGVDSSWIVLQRLYDQYAARLWSAGRVEDLHALLDAWYRIDVGPGGTEYYNLPIAPPLLTKFVLSDLQRKQDWKKVYDVSREYEFLSLPDHGQPASLPVENPARTVRWLHGLAALAIGEVPEVEDHVEFLDSFREEIPTDREAVSSMNELRQAIEAEEWKTAAEMITSEELPVGVLPADESLKFYQHASLLYRELVRSHPVLKHTMVDAFTDLANLRLEQASQTQEPDHLQAVTAQFPGTSVSHLAERQWADREFSVGRFAEACRLYKPSLDQKDAPKELVAKYKLAMAMTGRTSDVPLPDQISAPQGEQTKESFIAVVDALQKENAVAPAAFVKQDHQPTDRSIKAETVVSLSRDRKSQPAQIREFSTLLYDNLLLIHSHGSLKALRPETSTPLWEVNHNIGTVPSDYVRAAKPVLIEDRIMVPMWEKRFLWVMIERTSGKIIWKTPVEGIPCADPIVVGKAIYCFVIEPDRTNYGMVYLQKLSAVDGQVLSSKHVLQFQMSAELLSSCRCFLAGDVLILQANRTVYGVSTSGQVLWTRVLAFTPKNADAALYDGLVQQSGPFVWDDSFIVSAPGFAAVMRLRATDGKQMWVHSQPDIRTVAGITLNQLIVVTSNGLMALDLESGKPVWFRVLSVNPGAVAVTPNHVVAIALNKTDDAEVPPSERIRSLCWIQPKTGHVIHLSAIDDKPSCFDVNRCLVYGDHILAFSNLDTKNRTLKLLRIDPK